MTDRTDDTRDAELSEDEQFARLTEDNPLFAEGAPSAPKLDADDGEDDKDKTDEDGGAPAQADAPAATPDAATPPSDDTPGGVTTQPEAGAPAPAAGEDPFPGYSALPDEARQAFDALASERRKFENDYKALHGMTAPLQRGNEELRRQLQSQTARIQQLEQLERKQQDVSAAKDKAIQEFDEWAKQYPEESQAITALVNPLREKVATLEGSLDAARAELGNLHADRQQAALAREIGELEKVHGDWREIHESPNYWEWLNRQTPGIQSLNGSMFAGDTIQLLNLYKGSHAPAPAPPPAAPSNPPSNPADAVQQRRNQALQRGTQPAVRQSESSPGGVSRTQDMTDEDAQFAALVADNPNFR